MHRTDPPRVARTAAVTVGDSAPLAAVWPVHTLLPAYTQAYTQAHAQVCGSWEAQRRVAMRRASRGSQLVALVALVLLVGVEHAACCSGQPVSRSRMADRSWHLLLLSYPAMSSTQRKRKRR